MYTIKMRERKNTLKLDYKWGMGIFNKLNFHIEAECPKSCT